MNFVGKILTVLILVFSIAFLMIAATIFQSHRVWRNEAEKNKNKVDELNRTVVALQNEVQLEKNRLQMETVARRFALAALQSKSVQTQAQLEARQRELGEAQKRVSTMTTQIESTSQTLSGTLTQNDKLRTTLRDAQQHRDESFGKVVQLTDQLHQSQGAMVTMQEYNKQLLDSNGRMKYVLDRKGIDEFVSIDGPPRVDGVVTKVGERNYLEISIGEDDGLKRGHTLEVVRNNSYLGRVVVREVLPDRAVVQVIPEFRKGSILKGDRVASKLD